METVTTPGPRMLRAVSSVRRQRALPEDPRRSLRIFDHEPDLLIGIDAKTAQHLRLRVGVRQLGFESGTWSPYEAPGPAADMLGLLVTEGVMARTTSIFDRRCCELVGAGDLLRPWDDCGAAQGPAESSWRVLAPTRVAVLDARFADIAGRWPSIISQLISRTLARSRALSFQLAIAGVRRADDRLLLLAWHLADRWGRVRPDGTLLPIPLTHDLLAQLARLRRPAASAALVRLAHNGKLIRTRNGEWLLTGEFPSVDAAATLAATA
jgi:CRP-like cAMP-binding protein